VRDVHASKRRPVRHMQWDWTGRETNAHQGRTVPAGVEGCGIERALSVAHEQRTMWQRVQRGNGELIINRRGFGEAVR